MTNNDLKNGQELKYSGHEIELLSGELNNRLVGQK